MGKKRAIIDIVDTVFESIDVMIKEGVELVDKNPERMERKQKSIRLKINTLLNMNLGDTVKIFSTKDIRKNSNLKISR